MLPKSGKHVTYGGPILKRYVLNREQTSAAIYYLCCFYLPSSLNNIGRNFHDSTFLYVCYKIRKKSS